ncbi:Ribonucleases P/MRP protein subunit POP1 [Echinococcus granulosus]|uniref:Ribonucleases P:MRP protein subunit POP1 n=1 Tax=Echinococcus granulosus TaxID=6210 RepID=A0A068WD82_ECHGR|nr:Ribonucleases P/MRP protein subunit POP1 [Echinococcus granulosus]CDS17690.1 ribonucleases P:MRP protein subunit POP1 [Echinococcus granulosus]
MSSGSTVDCNLDPNNGDSEAVALNVDVLRLLAARSAEMMACEASVHLATARAIAPLQRLPVRLRRRAASHQIHRLPRRLHHGLAQAMSQKLVKQAKRCRRYRRRSQRLMALATRCVLPPTGEGAGEGRTRWIPTALWHAKRFHVVQNWGWRLPFAPTDKMFKALQRATTDRCMLLDHGYLSCFSVSGPFNLLRLCVAETTLPFFVSSIGIDLPSDASPSTGFHESVGLLCSEAMPTQQPMGVASLPNISRSILGPVRILWSATIQEGHGQRRSTLWFWLHPSMSSDAWKLFTSLDYVSTDLEASIASLKLVDCTGHLCRMKLIGPFAHQVLADIIKPPSSSTHSTSTTGEWALWRALCAYQKAGLLPTGCAVALLCAPFLHNRPLLKLYNRNWLIQVPKEGEVTTQLAPGFVSKSLTSSELTKLLLDHCDVEFDALLTRWFSSPEPCCFSDMGIPILLIQNGTPSLVSQKSQCIGWDVVLPRQLLKPSTRMAPPQEAMTEPPVETSAPRDFVVACTYRGVRVGGLRDQLRWASLTTEAAGRVDAFPYVLWPDTPAACCVTDEKVHLKVERDPKGRLTGDAKRRARIKFRCFAPMTKDWLQLLKPVLLPTAGDGFFVLRDKAMLVLVVRRLLTGDPRARHLTVEHLSRYDPRLPRALVMVKLEVTSRGVPEARAEIFALLATDDPSLGPISDKAPRTLLGYVDEGAYAFSHGFCIAIGFISLAAVCSLSPTERPSKGFQTVLFRSLKSSNLYGAKMTVII